MMTDLSKHPKFADADLYTYGNDSIKILLDFIKQMQRHNIDLNYSEYSYIVDNITCEWSVEDNHFIRYKMDYIAYMDIIDRLYKKYHYAMTKMKYHELKQKYKKLKSYMRGDHYGEE